MKLNKKLILTLAASLVMAACGNSGSKAQTNIPGPHQIQQPKQLEQPKQLTPQYSGYLSNYATSNVEFTKFSATTATQVQPTQLNLYQFEKTSGKYNSFTGKEVIAEKTHKSVSLSSITVQGLDGSDYKLYLLAPNSKVYYGFYSDALNNEITSIDDKYNNYFYLFDKNTISKDVPTSLTATYVKEDGFIYGSTGKEEGSTHLPQVGTVNLRFVDGKAQGEVIDRSGHNEEVFTFSGDSKNLVITPTDKNRITTQRDPASMELNFIDSKQGANDYKYVTGTTKGDHWSGVLAAEQKP